ncbi:hypothetical protein TVAG_018030 [Trichomonas vaginalis G3]|uniref:Uncharacterized protein n=1 Tax=Trichomonas vaginalis (strain ATCC PRA-98 / G3) TaxID=412133 RepID=A2FEU2_TRIV3|nr:hypothetical protein TVAGG3_0932240 [Trichomonas vaginalis G3]EAX96589.1 hypothetical protein TVAG_018030 [Trichomonas vaginalis G3]KAI5485919.1 hypothetical protein TVAGG3_0932240 [Trichomonas vaginalis G3]|eukprot:XP_001309519.1 hypothetical protein [Trichomonas vaginalis G3]
MTEKAKDITYKIVIPEDSSVNGDEILDNQSLKTRPGGFCGENLIVWLVAEWGENASYLGKVVWEPTEFQCELTVKKLEHKKQHFSTVEINPKQYNHKSVVRNLQAAVPLSVSLFHTPVAEAQFTIWKDNYSTRVTSAQLQITLPVSYISTFRVETDSILINLDFSNSLCKIDSFDLRFAPQLKVSLSDYEKAFALRRVPNTSTYILSNASSEAIKLMKSIQLALSVIWNNKTMMSHFTIELPIPATSVGLLWIVPPLKKLKQTPLAVEVTNITNSPVDVKIELDDRPCIPLVKTVSIDKLEPNKRCVVDVPCVPCVSGIHELTYRVKIGNGWFKPLFKTMVNIE